MKSLLFNIGAGLLILLLFSGRTIAQVTQPEDPTQKNEVTVVTDNQFQGKNFTDKNKNGICDRMENATLGNQGRNFVDANQDGVCDNREIRAKENKNGFGHRYRYGQRNGQCCGRGPCGGKGWKSQ